jgi:succinate dehydrogenase flavin-adding protein (antitoxin of CptAB toxin-antitoxin module)
MLDVVKLTCCWVDGQVSDELGQYEDILNRETIDIFNFISGKDPVHHVQLSNIHGF